MQQSIDISAQPTAAGLLEKIDGRKDGQTDRYIDPDAASANDVTNTCDFSRVPWLS